MCYSYCARISISEYVHTLGVHYHLKKQHPQLLSWKISQVELTRAFYQFPPCQSACLGCRNCFCTISLVFFLLHFATPLCYSTLLLQAQRQSNSAKYFLGKVSNLWRRVHAFGQIFASQLRWCTFQQLHLVRYMWFVFLIELVPQVLTNQAILLCIYNTGYCKYLQARMSMYVCTWLGVYVCVCVCVKFMSACLLRNQSHRWFLQVPPKKPQTTIQPYYYVYQGISRYRYNTQMQLSYPTLSPVCGKSWLCMFNDEFQINLVASYTQLGLGQ